MVDHSHCVHERVQFFEHVGRVVWYECCEPGCEWSSYEEPSP